MDELLTKANMLMQSYKYAEAELLFRELMEMKPDMVEFKFLVGQILFLQQKYDEAVDYFRQSKSDFVDSHSWNMFGKSLEMSGNLNEAENAYQRAQSYETNHHWACLNLGFLYLRQLIFTGAEHEFRKIKFRSLIAIFSLGLIQALTGKWKDGEKTMKSAIKKRSYDNKGLKAALKIAKKIVKDEIPITRDVIEEMITLYRPH